MDEYATYKIWNGRKAPNNCGKYYCQKCGYVFRYKKDAETFNFCPCCGMKVIHDHENA